MGRAVINITSGLGKITRQRFPDILLQDIYRRSVVEPDNDISLGFSQRVYRADGRATLGMIGEYRDLLIEQDA